MTKKTSDVNVLLNSETSDLNLTKLPSSEKELGSFADRLKEVIGGQSVRSFAAACGLSDGGMRQYLAGKSEPGLDALIKIAFVGNVNINWLASGEGDKQKESYDQLLANALQNRGKSALTRLKWSVVLECFKKIPINNIFNNDMFAEIVNITNDYNNKNNILIDPKDVVDWCKEAWNYSEFLHDWYKNNYYSFKRGEVSKEHPFLWLINCVCNDENKGYTPLKKVTYPFADGVMTSDLGGELGEGFVHVPRYNVAASAGGGSTIHSEQIVDHLAFRADWVRNALGVPVSNLALINVTGDSMEPTLSNGDLILIDTGVSSVDDSGVYVLRFDEALKVKRLHSKVDSVDIISDNVRYPVETIKGDLVKTLNVVGRVVWCGRRM
ncbi:MAG TPA: helix-turn-helix transcriptional regulator [Dongiaceae bacterium]|nr:helix-turn-helix transcriptional regulator [Dongiaceae bacterium]